MHARARSQPAPDMCTHTDTETVGRAPSHPSPVWLPLGGPSGGAAPQYLPSSPTPPSLPPCVSIDGRYPMPYDAPWPRCPMGLGAQGSSPSVLARSATLTPPPPPLHHAATAPSRRPPWPSQTTRDARTHVCLHACVLACASTHRRSRVAAMCAAARACVVVRARARASRPPPPPPLPPSPCSLPPRAILPKEAARVTLGVRHNTHAPVCTALRRQSRGARAGLRPIRPRRPAAVRSGRSGRRRPSRRRAAPPT